MCLILSILLSAVAFYLLAVYSQIRMDRARTNLKLLSLAPVTVAAPTPETTDGNNIDHYSYGRAKYIYQHSLAQNLTRVRHYQTLLRGLNPVVVAAAGGGGVDTMSAAVQQ